MRINKFLASCGIASRRKVEEYILDGRITVNGQVTTNLSTDILENDVVLFDGKPVGYISSAQDDRNRKTVVSLIKTDARIYPVGRLDFNSEGLLLLTNDGELTNKLTHPKHNIGKTYIVKINSSITDREVNLVRNGVTIDGYKLHPCKIKVLDGSENYTRFEITIFEGRNREIRKMFEVIKKQVVYLKRIKIENLKLGNLKTGEYRKLSKAEIEYLKNL